MGEKKKKQLSQTILVTDDKAELSLDPGNNYTASATLNPKPFRVGLLPRGGGGWKRVCIQEPVGKTLHSFFIIFFI